MSEHRVLRVLVLVAIALGIAVGTWLFDVLA
jgi:uncharacterized membrane protein YwzB